MTQSPNGNTQPPSPPSQQEPPKPQPYGPGLLMIFGLGLTVLAAYCFLDLFVRGMPEEWRKAGNDWYIPMNWVVMIASAAGAAYAFVVAALRSRKAPV
ncbi:MAG: hypothetical protein IMZ44_24305 [Planctomycetes bacterium]|nr:hypothetical protein [Planctomycetota bacterium]